MDKIKKIKTIKSNTPKVIWTPYPGGQVKFLTCPVFECLFEGNRGPGKTDALLMDFAQFVGRGWGSAWQGILFRETYKNLQDVISKSHRWFRKIFPNATYNKSEHAWHFKTGEILYFSYARSVDDYWTYHGFGYPWIGWEELTNWKTEDLYLMMMSICRSSDPRVTVRRYRSTCNPAGPGHSWVKRRFIDQALPGEIITSTVSKEDLAEFGLDVKEDMISERVYVHGERRENLALSTNDPNYVMNLLQNSNEARKKAWIEGSWDILIGGMFDDLWDRKKHTVEPFDIPRSWRTYRAFDWGQSKPFSVGWWAVSDGSYAIVKGKKRFYPRGTLIRVGEWYGCADKPNTGLRLTNIQIGRGIKKRESDIMRLYDIHRIYKGPADASIFGEESDAESIASKISKAFYNKQSTKSLIFEKSNKASGTRVIGWQLIRDRLESVVNEDLEVPQMIIFNTCKDFVRTIREQQRDEKNPDDIDTEGEDHIADETRYMCLHVARKSEINRYKIHK